MKKIFGLILALCLLMTTAAYADTTINGAAKRNITVNRAAEHEPIEGESPTTGLPLDSYTDIPSSFLGLAVNGKYMPMFVQIDNAEGGVDKLAQWGIRYADIVYETPLNSAGGTRLSAVFSDILPDEVGPIRSARVGHVRLAAEWMGGFVHYGGQSNEGSDVNAEMRKPEIHIVREKNRFDGTDGTNKPWKKYFSVRAKATSPHDKSANVAALSELVSDEVEQVNHTFLFTDELPTAGDAATEIYIRHSSTEKYNSHLVYDEASNTYLRYMGSDRKLYVDRDTQEAIAFSNVIVQFTTVKYNGSGDAPVMETLGSGNADIFIGGRHIAGCWVHDQYHSRTVYYDEQGNEIALQRGKTLISVMDRSREVSYK